MPLYFAYGANMDAAAMARRCPGSRAVGVARLARHRLFITKDGYASVQRAPRDDVHGVLWQLAQADVRVLDRFEGIDRGLYRKVLAPVISGGGRSARALVYVASATQGGDPLPGYMDVILAAAADWRLPDGYCAGLAALARAASPRPGPAFRN